ncbi:MAG: hypothetical protein EAZ89_05055 [Bacteroidetes bacterium]|nr:MAG: hypothetical protein EAZ89_05055 [Bacteroidota bacterium]
MGSELFLLLVILLAIGSVGVGFVRNRNFRRKEALHQALADAYHLQIAYANELNFTIFGQHREYPVQIDVARLHVRGKREARYCLKISLPMTNPNRKSLRISRRNPDWSEFDGLAVIDRPFVVRHGISNWLEILTNDMIFSSLILSEDIKITLFEVFNPLEAGLLCIHDEELSFYYPGLLDSQEQHIHSGKILELLCDIKDELK